VKILSKRKSAESSRVNMGCRANHAAAGEIFDLELRSRFARLRRARRFLGELETDLPVLQFQIGGERPSPFRDETVEEIGFTRGEQFLRLLYRNLATQNCFA
jgi:hypothetical protein